MRTFLLLVYTAILSISFINTSNAQGNQPTAYQHAYRIGKGQPAILEWHPNGQQVAFQINGTDVITYDRNLEETNTILNTWGEQPVMSPDWTKIVTVGLNVYLYDVQQSTTIAELPVVQPPERPSPLTVWSPTSEQLAYFNETNQSIEIWNVHSLVLAASLPTTDGTPYAIGWSPDGTWIVTSHYDVLNLWDVSSQAIVQSLSTYNTVYSFDWNPTSDYIIVADATEFFLWNINIGETRMLPNSFGDIISVSWGQNFIATSHSTDDLIRIWELTPPDQIQLIDVLPAFPAPTYVGIDWSPTDDVLAIAAGSDIFLWDAAARVFIAHRKDFLAEPLTFSINSEGSEIAAVVRNRVGPDPVEIWDVYQNKFRQIMVPQSTDIVAVAMHPSDDVVAFTEADGTSYLFETSDEIYETLGNYGMVIEWDSSGVWIAATNESDATLLNVNTRNTVQINGSLSNGTWHPSQLWVVGLDAPSYGTPVVWDAQTGEELLRLNTGANAVAWSYDGSKLITAYRFTVSVWDATTGELQIAFDIAQIPSVLIEDHVGQLIVASTNHATELYDIATGQLAGELSPSFGLHARSTLQRSTDGTIFAQLGTGDLYYFATVNDPPQAPSNLQWDGVAVGADNAVGFTFQDDGSSDPDYRQEDGFEIEWRGGYQGTFTDWMPYATLPPHAGNGNTVAFSITPPIACQYDQIGVRVRAFYDTQPRLYSDWIQFTDVSLATC